MEKWNDISMKNVKKTLWLKYRVNITCERHAHIYIGEMNGNKGVVYLSFFERKFLNYLDLDVIIITSFGLSDSLFTEIKHHCTVTRIVQS